MVDFSRLEEDKFKLTQSQFFVGQGKDEGRIWPILLHSNQTNFPHLLESKEVVFEAELSADDDYVQLNHGNVSHFITNYSPDLYIKLLEAVTAGKLDDISRLQILQERSLLARGDKISSADLLRTLRFYNNEVSLSVWDMIGCSKKSNLKLAARRHQGHLQFIASHYQFRHGIHVVFRSQQGLLFICVRVYNPG